MVLVINGVAGIFDCPTDLDVCLQRKMKEHLSQPYFYLLKEISDLNLKEDDAYNKEKWSLGTRYHNKRQKLLRQRFEYLEKNNIEEPEPLKIEIYHT